MLFYAIVTLLFLGYLPQSTLPYGWIFPKDSLFFQEWRETNPDKYLSCRADFNGDNKPDTAYILESEEDDNYGIFVKLSSTGDNKLIYYLDIEKKMFKEIQLSD